MAAAFWSGAAVAPHHSAIRRQPATSLADRSWEWRLQDAMDVRSPASSVANGAERAHGYSRRENYLRFVPTLLRKNWLLKKKHPVALAFEVLTPVIVIVLMAAIRTTSHDKTVPAGFTLGTQSYNLYSPGGTSLIAPYYEVDVTPVASPPLLAVPETTMSGLLLHFGYLSFLQARRMDSFDTTNKIKCLTALTTQGMVSLNESSQYAVPDECEGRVSPFKLAIVPDTPFTRGYFFDTVKQWYPTVTLDMGNASDATLVIPSLEDSVVFYDSEEELEDYITSKEYAATAKHPRIFGAIVFEMFPGTATMGTPASIEYAVRLNGTYVGDDPDVRYVPRTNAQKDASLWNAYKRKLETLDYQQYTTNGFLTLQTLVTRFANCLPDWDTTTQTTTGKCQVNASTAILSDELESRLLQVAANDPATNFAVSLYNSFVTTDEVTDASAAINMNLAAETRQALLQPLLQAPQPILGALTTPFPINTFRSSSFYDAVSDVFPIFFVIAYIHPLSKVLVSLISERETRSRELMKILGVNDSCIVISWYITYIAIFLVGSILQTIAASINLFPSSSVLLLFLFFFLFSLSVLAFGFLVSSVFSKARTGTYVGFIGFFILYAVSNAFTESSPESSKALACLLAPVGLVFGVQSLADAETSHVGVSLTGSINNFTFATALIFFAIDTALYTLLGIYLEKVVPKEFGTTEKWYFPFKPSYWRKSAAKAAVVATPRRPLISNDDKMETDAEVEQEDDYRLDLAANIEPVSSDLLDQERRGDALVVNGLCKQFPVPGGIKEAVKNLHVTMYAGQITCLLGHNGAGKTTLISMLTGVTAPTSGDATIHGLSLREDIASIRESLGICFQHDVLYPELTVRDHLEFYARIKGFSGDEINAEVESKIKEVGLGDKRDTIASALSGGMKRKLSVAISLLGDSSLVFLDEPTSGMDPYSRRSIWEVLLSNRRNRVMVLTTHFMDEADILGDRIAIMAEGELRCCGSALFLKNRYGVGYNLTMVKKQDRNSDSDDESETGAAAIEFITQRIPSAKVLSNVGAEVAFQLPLDASSLFPKLFRDLDARLDKLSLRSYGISVTTMEEVFIKVAEAATEDFNRHLAATNGHQAEGTQKDKSSKTATDDYVCLVDGTSDDSSATSFDPATQNSGNHRMFFVQSAALLQKRIRIAKRDRKMFVVGLALPIIWLIIGLSLVKVGDITKSDPSMPLTLDKLPSKTKTGTILLPSYCESDVDTNGWCASSLVSADSGDEIRTVSLSQDVVGSPAYSTDSPTVFNVTYSNPSVNASDATGYQLRLSQVIHSRAFSSGIADQFGGYLIHADSDARQFGYNLLVNTTLVHAAAVFKARIDESLFQLMMSEFESSTASSLTLKVSNHPLPLTRDARALFTSFLSFSACMFIVIAFAYYPASIVVQLVRERFPEKNAKHQQLVAGAGIPAFWAANYVFDMVVFLVPCIVALVLLQVYDLGSFTGGSSCVTCSSSTFMSVIILFIAFGLAVIPYAYCWSFVFRDPPSSQTYMIMINFVIGLALMIVSFTMQVISDSTKDVDDALQFIWRLSPLFCLGRGLLNLTIIEITHLAYQLEDQISTDPFALENTGWPLIYLIFDAILYTAIAVAADYAKSFPSIKESVFARYLPRWAQSKIPDNDDDATQAEAIDEDVAAETERVLCNNGGSTDVVELRNLRKVYHSKHKGEAKTTVAVKKLTFGLPRGECFGFLGINGAGKTTTMKMLTGDVAPTAGSALLAGGLDIQTQQLAIRRQIGYCPQFDALMDLLTVREHLELFAKIKGISPHSRVVSEVDSKMEQLGLVEFADRLAGSLSGGNKRKLSVAIALMGEPPIIFLDEPSTGMDPVSRRFMWDVIARQSTRRKQSTVVLTTHSMEECEALCSRVGIMVSGSLQCLGSVQHLKNRFGDGVLMFDAKLSPPEPSKVHRLALTHFDKTDARISTRQQLLDACTRLGDASWADKIDKNHPTGYALADQLDRPDELDGGISALALAEWWLAESQFEAVAEFLDENFGAGAELLERKHDSCWFKLKPDSSGALRLANVFEVVEHAKARLAIREYSVSQTTLEQIFNSFASKQPREME